MPWPWQTQVKLQACLSASGRRARRGHVPGLAGYRAGSHAVLHQRGDCSVARPASRPTTQQVVRIVEPNAMLEDRQRQMDLRFTRAIRVVRMTVSPKFDIYNLTNSSAVMGSIAGYGASWLRPTDILTARIVKFGAQVDW